jgi:hypothetical protein
VEAAARFLPINPVLWDPRDNPPAYDGTWDTAVVPCQTFDQALRVYQWMQLGQHPFKSLVVDSITELQNKALEQIAGRGMMQTQQWGELLRALGGYMRDLRDLTAHPTNPLEAVVLTAMSRESQDGKMKPHLQGQAAVIAPYLWDVIGYINVESFPYEDPTQGTYTVRRMYVNKNDKYETGERVQGRIGPVIEQDQLNIATLLDLVFPAEKEAAPTPTA